MSELVGVLVFFLIVFLVAYLAHYVINHFLPEPIRMVALIVVGVILLLVIIQFLIGIGGISWPSGPLFKR